MAANQITTIQMFSNFERQFVRALRFHTGGLNRTNERVIEKVSLKSYKIPVRENLHVRTT